MLKSMAVASAAPVQDYLGNSYSADREYVDGEVRERNAGEYHHAQTQTSLVEWFLIHRSLLRLRTLTERRVQVSGSRYRIPDVCVVPPGHHRQPVFTEPPYLCIEVVSKDDPLREVRERAEDYLNMGVPTVWIIDPSQWRGYTVDHRSMHGAKGRILRTRDGDLTLSLPELFTLSDADWAD